ncbi:uncharacterized protein LOC142497154 [Ascaphus truei]|uniref:uncharacterized protein LOC142497154 n=1 Tax=Ascaphus truei TaxID=8439 RepID=UPI003F59C061
MKDTTLYRTQMKLKDLLKKQAQLVSDIIFLRNCKKKHLIPKGLVLKNPLATTYNTKFSQQMCTRNSERLRNHLISICYSNRRKIKATIDSILETGEIRADIWRGLRTFHEKLLKGLISNKEKKLHRLRLRMRYSAAASTTSNNINIHSHQQQDRTVNISDYTPNQAESSVLSKGVTFCPTKPMDKIELCSDLEEFFKRLRLKELFHDRHDQDRANTAEGGPLHMSREKQKSNWIPQTGRNPKQDRYIESFRHRAKTTILDKVRKQTYNLTLIERRAIESLKANHNITIKPADKGGAVVIMNTTDNSLMQSIPPNCSRIQQKSTWENSTGSLKHSRYTQENKFWT